MLCVKREGMANVDAETCHDGICGQGRHPKGRGVVRQAELEFPTATQTSFGLLYCLLESLQQQPNLHPKYSNKLPKRTSPLHSNFLLLEPLLLLLPTLKYGWQPHSGLSLHLVSLSAFALGNLIYSHRRGLQTLLTLTHLSAPALLIDLSSLVRCHHIKLGMFKTKPTVLPLFLTHTHTLAHSPQK